MTGVRGVTAPAIATGLSSAALAEPVAFEHRPMAQERICPVKLFDKSRPTGRSLRGGGARMVGPFATYGAPRPAKQLKEPAQP